MELRIIIRGNRAELSVINAACRVVGRTAWEDKRDLSVKLFAKMEALLKREGIALGQVRHVSFACDSPYFARKERWQEMKLEDMDSTGRCGFTAWQTGEIIAKVMNFALEK